LEQALLGLCVVAGVIFGFIIAWISLRSERTAIFEKGKAEGVEERAALEERVKQKDLRIEEIYAERAQERAEIERLREEAATLRAAQTDFEQRLATAAEQARLAVSAKLAAQEEMINTLRAALDDRLLELDAARLQLGDREVELKTLRAAIAEREAKLAALEQRAAELDSLRGEIAELRASGVALRTALGEKDALLKDLRESQQRLADTFKALAGEALQNASKDFVDLARRELERLQGDARGSLEEVVTPLKQQLEKMDQSVSQMELARAEADGRLREQLTSLHGVQQQLRAETANLVSALRMPAVRGRWGEVQLRRVVELAGMLKHVDFDEQPTVESDQGIQRPDMIIHLPSRRQIVVDAKVSLQAFLEALEAQDEATRQAKLSAHAAQVRAHLTKLADKRYWNQFPEAPEFVVAFLPAETFFSAALQQDPSLIEFGAEQGVILATPTTLIALLKAVAYGWQQERLAENARLISQLGQELYNRLRTFLTHVEDMRRNLSRTVEAYNRAAGSLESRVLVTARRFRDLGAATSDELDTAELIDEVPRTLHALDQSTLQFDAPPKALTASELFDAER
jgi:DNA recombination protein RmuC